MLNWLWHWVFRRFLSAYIESIGHVTFDLFKGIIQLEDVVLTDNIVSDASLPAQIVKGYVQQLRVELPWYRLRFRTAILLKDVFLVAVPTLLPQYDAKGHNARVAAEKQAALAAWEVQNRSTRYPQEQYPSFAARWAAQFIDNVVVDVHGIHVRFEDAVSFEEPYTFGLRIDAIHAKGANRQLGYLITRDNAVGFKVVSVDGLAVYWHSTGEEWRQLDTVDIVDKMRNESTADANLLRPINLSVKLAMQTIGVPGLFLGVGLDDLDLVFQDAQQYRQLMGMLNHFSSHAYKIKYHRFRPEQSPKANPMAWFRYAGRCVLHDVRLKSNCFNAMFWHKRRIDRIEYMKAYALKIMSKNETLTGTDLVRFNELETTFSFEDLRFFRSAVHDMMHTQIAAKEAAAARLGKLSQLLRRLIFGSPTRQQLDVVRDQNAADMHVDPTILGEDTVGTKMVIRVAGMSIILGQAGAEMVRIDSGNIETVMYTGSRGMKMLLSMGRLDLVDVLQTHSQYSRLLTASQAPTEKTEAVKEPLIRVSYSVGTPSAGGATGGTDIDVDIKPVYIVYNKLTFDRLGAFFALPSSPRETQMAEMVGSNPEHIRRLLNERARVSYKVKIAAPTIIIPHDCTIPNGLRMVVDMKDLAVEWGVEVRRLYKPKDPIVAEDFYTDYKIKSPSVELFLMDFARDGDPVANCRRRMSEPFELSLVMGMPYVAYYPNLPGLRLDMDMSKMQLYMSGRMYRVLMLCTLAFSVSETPWVRPHGRPREVIEAEQAAKGLNLYLKMTMGVKIPQLDIRMEVTDHAERAMIVSTGPMTYNSGPTGTALIDLIDINMPGTAIDVVDGPTYYHVAPKMEMGIKVEMVTDPTVRFRGGATDITMNAMELALPKAAYHTMMAVLGEFGGNTYTGSSTPPYPPYDYNLYPDEEMYVMSTLSARTQTIIVKLLADAGTPGAPGGLEMRVDEFDFMMISYSTGTVNYHIDMGENHIRDTRPPKSGPALAYNSLIMPMLKRGEAERTFHMTLDYVMNLNGDQHMGLVMDGTRIHLSPQTYELVFWIGPYFTPTPAPNGPPPPAPPPKRRQTVAEIVAKPVMTITTHLLNAEVCLAEDVGSATSRGLLMQFGGNVVYGYDGTNNSYSNVDLQRLQFSKCQLDKIDTSCVALINPCDLWLKYTVIEHWKGGGHVRLATHIEGMHLNLSYEELLFLNKCLGAVFYPPKVDPAAEAAKAEKERLDKEKADKEKADKERRAERYRGKAKGKSKSSRSRDKGKSRDILRDRDEEGDSGAGVGGGSPSDSPALKGRGDVPESDSRVSILRDDSKVEASDVSAASSTAPAATDASTAVATTPAARPIGTYITEYYVSSNDLQFALFDTTRQRGQTIPLIKVLLPELYLDYVDYKWIAYKADVTLVIAVDFYNINVPTWEPLLEPWKCRVRYTSNLLENDGKGFTSIDILADDHRTEEAPGTESADESGDETTDTEPEDEVAPATKKKQSMVSRITGAMKTVASKLGKALDRKHIIDGNNRSASYILNLNVSPPGLDVINRVSAVFAAAELPPTTAVWQVFEIFNATGHVLRFWKSGDPSKKISVVEPGVVHGFSFYPPKEDKFYHRNLDIPHMVNVQIAGGWLPLRNISMDRVGQQVLSLSPALDSIDHRIVCEVEYVEETKRLTLRSTMKILNTTSIPMDVLMDVPGSKPARLPPIPAKGWGAVPVKYAYHARLHFRPHISNSPSSPRALSPRRRNSATLLSSGLRSPSTMELPSMSPAAAAAGAAMLDQNGPASPSVRPASPLNTSGDVVTSFNFEAHPANNTSMMSIDERDVRYPWSDEPLRWFSVAPDKIVHLAFDPMSAGDRAPEIVVVGATDTPTKAAPGANGSTSSPDKAPKKPNKPIKPQTVQPKKMRLVCGGCARGTKDDDAAFDDGEAWDEDDKSPDKSPDKTPAGSRSMEKSPRASTLDVSAAGKDKGKEKSKSRERSSQKSAAHSHKEDNAAGVRPSRTSLAPLDVGRPGPKASPAKDGAASGGGDGHHSSSDEEGDITHVDAEQRPMYLNCSAKLEHYSFADVKNVATNPEHVFTLSAPLVIENMLPVPAFFQMAEKRRATSTLFLDSGDSSPIYEVNGSSTIQLRIKMGPDMEWSQATRIKIGREEMKADYVCLFKGKKGTSDTYVDLQVARASPHTPPVITIFAKYWILNRSGVEISYGQHRDVLAPLASAGLQIPKQDDDDPTTTPFLFSYPVQSGAKKMALMMPGRSNWSKPFSLETVGATGVVEMEGTGKNSLLYELGMSIELAPGIFRRSRIITFSPRFTIVNQLAQPLNIKQVDAPTELVIEAGGQTRWHRAKEKKGVVRVGLRDATDKDTWNWSYEINVMSGGIFFANVYTSDLRRMEQVRFEVKMKGVLGTILVSPDTGTPEYRVANETEESIIIWQEGFKEHRRSVAPFASIDFTWDSPCAENREICVALEADKSRVESYQLSEIGICKPLKTATGEIAVEIEVDKSSPTRVLYLRSHPKLAEVHVADGVPCIMEFKAVIAGIGISVIDAHPQELLYVRLTGLVLEMEDDEQQWRSTRVVLEDMQIDNDLPDAIHNVILHTRPPEDEEQEPLPFLHVALSTLQKETPVAMRGYLNLLMQEIDIKLDEALVTRLLGLINDLSAPKPNAPPPPKTELKFQKEEKAERTQQVYYSMLMLSPIKVNITFLSSGSKDSSVLQDLMNIDLLLPSLSDAPLALNALILENVFTTQEALSARITEHYVGQIIRQGYKILGSLDIIGNPVKLFDNISTGVADLFFEPAKGLMLGPKEFGIGLGKGASSLTKHLVYGLFGTAGAITGSISKVMAKATLDQDYIRRHEAFRRKRARHAGHGLLLGMQAFGRGVAEGAVGLIWQPIKGAKEDGFVGFVKGVGKGVVGAALKPTAGALDLITKTTEGIRNTSQMEQIVVRLRPPRWFGPDGILTLYDWRLANHQLTLMTIRNCAYKTTDKLIDGTLIETEKTVVLISTRRIFLVGALPQDYCIDFNPPGERLSSDRTPKWIMSLSDLKRVEMGGRGIRLMDAKMLTASVQERGVEKMLARVEEAIVYGPLDLLNDLYDTIVEAGDGARKSGLRPTGEAYTKWDGIKDKLVG